MKKLLILAGVLIGFTSSAKDLIFLQSGEKISATIIDVRQDTLFYVKGKNGTAQFLLSNEVAFIQLDKKNTRVHQILQENIVVEPPVDEIKMLEGKLDANLHHNRGFGNFCLGFFFGPFGVLGTAIGKPRSPDYVKIPKKENLENTDYLKGYEKRARGKNVLHAVGGWAVVVLLSLVL